MFIHCLFTGYKKEYKNKGYGSMMIDNCIKEAEKMGLDGAAVIARKGSFMAKKRFFKKRI